VRCLTQFRWYEIIGDPTLADAILYRIIHNAYRIALTGDSMRKLKAAHAEPEAKSPQTKSEEIDAMTKNIAFKDVNQGTALGALPLTLLVAQLCGQRYERRDGRAAYR